MDRPIVSIFIGVLALIGGLLALFNPLAATLTAETMAAYFFIAIGVLQIIGAFQGEGMASKILGALLGVVLLLVGISLLTNPLSGIISLTVVVAILLLTGGIAKIIMAFGMGIGRYWLLALSGALSLVLAFMIFSNFPGSAVITLGVLLGVELVSNGVALIMLGLAGRNSATA